MRLSTLAPLAAALALPSPVLAKPKAAKPTPAVEAPVPATAPRLLIMISVDQLASDLFERYSQHYTGGLARLMSGAAFPSGYQSHAATETCPGHSTLMTGAHPARTGIIANDWMAPDASGKLVEVYCAEDEANKPASGEGYTPSAVHLLVPTLGERVKARWPQAKTVSVAGKDRAALMMGGKSVDTIYFRWGPGFSTIAGRTVGPEAQEATAKVQALLASGAPAMEVPAWCGPVDRAVPVGEQSIGAGHFELKPGDANGFIRSPRFDQATLDLATQLIDSQKLGADGTPDVLTIGLSATDYIGHAYGNGGAESCIQMAALDAMLGRFFDHLDAEGIDYLAVLSADHGGLDMPERQSQQAVPTARRVDPALLPGTLGKAVAADLGLDGSVLMGSSAAGDLWLNPALSPADRARAAGSVRTRLLASPDVAAVFTGEELTGTDARLGDPRGWTLRDRARASYHPGRSGDLVVLLQPAVTPISKPGPGYVATHGSPWDYDRRVPMLFWRKGMTHMDQPMAVETVDIAPTLAALVGLPVAAGEMDGRCLDLDPTAADTCTP